MSTRSGGLGGRGAGSRSPVGQVRSARLLGPDGAMLAPSDISMLTSGVHRVRPVVGGEDSLRPIQSSVSMAP
jgi:hypothetical protein